MGRARLEMSARGFHILVAIITVVGSARGVEPAPVGVDDNLSIL